MKKTFFILGCLLAALITGCSTNRVRATKTTPEVRDASGKVITPGSQTVVDVTTRGYFQQSSKLEEQHLQLGPETIAMGTTGLSQSSDMGAIMGQAVMKGMELAAQVYTAGLAGRNAPSVVVAPATPAATAPGYTPIPIAGPAPLSVDHVKLLADGTVVLCNKDESICLPVPPSNVIKKP
jgi:hypothetical protein